MPYQNLLVNRTSKFQTNTRNTQNNSSNPYEDQIKKRLNKRQFSTYKLHDQKVNGIDLIGQIRYVSQDYWTDYYTVVYQPFGNPYPNPPAEP